MENIGGWTTISLAIFKMDFTYDFLWLRTPFGNIIFCSNKRVNSISVNRISSEIEWIENQIYSISGEV